MDRLSWAFGTLWRSALVLLTLQIAVVSLAKYVTGGAEAPPPILANAFADPFLLIHVVSGVIALVTGPIQFVRSLRSRFPAFHRATGRLFLSACLIGALSGFILALGTFAGPIAGSGFALQALLTALFACLGLRSVLERRFEAHREWMLRAYALIAAAITLRLMLPASIILGYEFLPAYQVIAWACWTLNLALCEFYIRRQRVSAVSFRTAATA